MTLIAPTFELDGASEDNALSTRNLTIGPPSRRTPDRLGEEITRKWWSTREIMRDGAMNYWQNLAFYLGHQWVWWSQTRQAIMPYPEGPRSPVGGKRVRLTVNRFRPNVDNVLGRMMRSELSFEVPPTDTSDSLIEGAKRSEKVLEGARVDQGWERVRFDALFAALLAGTSAVSVEWDDNAGRQIQWSNELGDVAIGTGDVRLRSHNVNEFVLEPNVREARDARWWISGLALPVGYVQEYYELGWLPRPDANQREGSLGQSLTRSTGHDHGRNLCLVLTYYERPSKGSKGRYVCVVNGATVHDGPWPFEFPELNLHTFRWNRIDGQWMGSTYLNDAVPIQVAYNFVRSALQEHFKLAGNARLMAPFGSLYEEDLHSAAGDLLYWSPDGSGVAPQYLSPPNLPRWYVDESAALREELDNVMHVHDVSRGVGFDRAAAQALTFLAEQDDSGFSPAVWDQKQGWERIASQVLTLYGSRATDTRKLSLPVAPGVSEPVEWNGRMLMGQYRVVVPNDAVTPRNAAARLANAKDLWDRKIITDARQYARMSGLPAEEFGQLLDPDAAKANTENLRMLMGVPEIPDDFDDHAVHIAEHNDRCRKTDAYKYAPEEYRRIVDEHVKYHENKAANEHARQVALERAQPMASTVPQADAPAGSDVPMSEQEEQGRMAAAAAMGMNPSGLGMGGGLNNEGGGAPPLPAAGLPSGGGLEGL